MRAQRAVPAETKTCSTCGKTLPLTDFYVRNKATGARHGVCKGCKKAKVSEYAKDNPEKRRETRSRYNRSEKGRAAWQSYYQANRSALLQKGREYKSANPDKRRDWNLQRLARKKGVAHEPYDRADIFARWGPECTYCPSPADCLDHVVPISKGGPDATHNLVPACTPCNSSKGAKSLAEWALTFGAVPASQRKDQDQ